MMRFYGYDELPIFLLHFNFKIIFLFWGYCFKAHPLILRIPKYIAVKKSLILLICFVSLSIVSCFEDQDDNIVASSTNEINDFIWRGLNYFYLYKADTPELADDAFASETEYQDFLNSFDTPESFFNFLKSGQDEFSILVDDYVALENELAGVTLSNGMEFGLVYYPDGSANIYGYVRYVMPNSDASDKGIQRGNIFNSVNGSQLTDTNFSDLLSGDSYTIGLADFDGTTITPNGESISLTKSEYAENPIHTKSILEINGHTIGYLMYNAFINEYDTALNTAFAEFQAAGVTDLVIDLRYNGGGSVRTATYMAGMITGNYTGQVFYSETWNADRQSDYAEDGLFLDSFSGGQALNSLNLDQVYVLTTPRTASASELVINGLAPYIDVVQIGTNTRGKYQASFLLYDAPAPNFSRSQANPGHTYAMLPLVFKTANASGNTDYSNGLSPDIELAEDYSNLGVLGDANEPLLATAISEIIGVPAPFAGRQVHYEEIADSGFNKKTKEIMYIKK